MPRGWILLHGTWFCPSVGGALAAARQGGPGLGAALSYRGAFKPSGDGWHQRRVVNLQTVVVMRLVSASLMRLLSVTVYLVFLARFARGLSVATWVLVL